MLINIIVGAVIVGIIALAVYKVVKDKKAGAKCVGCPYAGKCTSCPSDFDYETK